MSGSVSAMVLEGVGVEIVQPVRIADAAQIHVREGDLMTLGLGDGSEGKQSERRCQVESVVDAIGGLNKSQTHEAS